MHCACSHASTRTSRGARGARQGARSSTVPLPSVPARLSAAADCSRGYPPPHRAAPGSFASVRHARPFGSNMWRHCRRSNPETAAVAKHNMSFSRSSLKMAVEGAGNQGSALSPACNAAGSHLATRAAGGGGPRPPRTPAASSRLWAESRANRRRTHSRHL